MSLTTRQIQLILEEIGHLTIGGTIRNIWDSSPHDIYFEIRTPGTNHYLILSVKPDATRYHLLSQKPPKAREPRAFTMQLRKWLQGKKIEAIQQLQQDRIIQFQIYSHFLIAELTGRHGNIFLLDDNRQILGSLHPSRSISRLLRPGQCYQLPDPPPNTDRKDQDELALNSLPADGSRSRVIEANFSQMLLQRSLRNRLQRLKSQLGQRIKFLERRVLAIEKNLVKATEAKQYRQFGELLQAAYGQVEKGEDSITVINYFDEAMPSIQIPLNPTLDLQGNIDYYFRRYRKYAQAIPDIEAQLINDMEALEKVTLVKNQILELTQKFESNLDHPEVLQHLASLEKNESLKSIIPLKKYTLNRTLPYREYISKTGKTMMVGKSSKDNDYLTLKVAKSNDLWLHTRDWEGSHVILKLNKNEEPDSESMLDAATLAAWYSKGKNDATVEVIYTRVKYVKKPKGLPPGQVIYTHVRSLAVYMEAERMSRLFNTKNLPE